jgi:protein TonB
VEEIFKVVEDMPRFPGCEDMSNKDERKKCAEQKMLEYIYKNIKYPAIARENGVEGTVVITFVVETDGTITAAQIARDIGAQCGQEALKVVESMPKWIPGKQRGRAVRVQFNLPVKFKLE